MPFDNIWMLALLVLSIATTIGLVALARVKFNWSVAGTFLTPKEIAEHYNKQRCSRTLSAYDEPYLSAIPKVTHPEYLIPCFSWIEDQSETVKRRRERLLTINGLLQNWVIQANNAKAKYLQDRVLVRLQLALEDENPSVDFLEQSKEKLVKATEAVAHLADVLLWQLSVEKTRKTFSLVKGEEGRRQFYQEYDNLGQAMHDAKKLAEYLKVLIRAPIEDDIEEESTATVKSTTD